MPRLNCCKEYSLTRWPDRVRNAFSKSVMQLSDGHVEPWTEPRVREGKLDRRELYSLGTILALQSIQGRSGAFVRLKGGPMCYMATSAFAYEVRASGPKHSRGRWQTKTLTYCQPLGTAGTCGLTKWLIKNT
jgi:hypothetical protein